MSALQLLSQQRHILSKVAHRRLSPAEQTPIILRATKYIRVTTRYQPETHAQATYCSAAAAASDAAAVPASAVIR